MVIVDCDVDYKQVRNVMIQNIDKVLERGDRLETLVDKTANMQNNAFRFKKQTRRFRSTIWWRNVKLMYFLSTMPFLLWSNFNLFQVENF